MSETVKSYELSHEKGVVINGEKFPYLVAVDPQWRVSPLGDEDMGMHVVWLPLIAEGSCPEVGEPDGVVLGTDAGYSSEGGDNE